jgi:hypothetical protein
MMTLMAFSVNLSNIAVTTPRLAAGVVHGPPYCLLFTSSAAATTELKSLPRPPTEEDSESIATALRIPEKERNATAAATTVVFFLEQRQEEEDLI